MAAGGWRIFVCGTNHTFTTVEEREPLGFGREELATVDAAFAELPEVAESVIISTCNRTEFYFVASRRTDPFAVVSKFFRVYRELDISPLDSKFYRSYDREAAEHLFRVVGGLDSMVLGENQVFGQVKDAYSAACSVKAAGKVIHRLFHQAFRVGKQIRTDTEMGKGACSVSSAAMELLRARQGELSEPSVLFVGVNQMISLAAANLGREAHGRFYFANRTPEKAEVLALRYDGLGCG
ncbi:MAG: glutamyl-tRNA reductase, partial [Bacteroidetes bacterium]|nr:glutamyl-tRNA reductase [Bacteroidota bacterium]